MNRYAFHWGQLSPITLKYKQTNEKQNKTQTTTTTTLLERTN